jgi:ribosome biogenesis GTPase
MTASPTLARLGWQPFFQQQLRAEEWERCKPARVISQERSVLGLAGADFDLAMPILPAMPAMTVGDWVLLDEDLRFRRLLERSSLFKRKAAGTGVAAQLIAANVDTLFIVSSLNQDFNLNRLERYLVLAHEAQVQVVVVLTKEDLCADPQEQIAQASALGAGLLVLPVNALDPQSVRKLAPWCGPGQTIALMGSSGVGKSTLVNSLLGESVQPTQAIRADDAKGRHTTTRRSLHMLADGGLLLDTPGMRELQLFACEQGIEETFADVGALAAACRFADCAHGNEPGCAVRAALEAGTLDARRVENYGKLLREQQRNAATLGEQRARERQLGRQHRWAKLTHERKRKKDEG